jgi:hypothetical protein
MEVSSVVLFRNYRSDDVEEEERLWRVLQVQLSESTISESRLVICFLL